MSFKIKENLSAIVASTSKQSIALPTSISQIGKVYGVIIDETSVPKELFDRSGGFSGIGTIFYLDYNQSKNTINVDLNICKTAKPFYSDNQNYPLIGELVYIIDGPNPASQIQSNQTQKYYLGTVNVWNNNQQNSLTSNPLGKTFTENADIRNLLSFEGDRIYQGRKGNGIRFGSTVKSKSNKNEWSSVGNDGDPITILVNGYVTINTGSLAPNIEEINKEMSSIYMTSTQMIPLLPDRNNTLNPLTQPLLPNKYIFPQIIVNSDRITLNSKKDEVMIFAKTNVEVNTNNIINLNAGGRVHLNTPIIWLGTKKNNTQPTEPLILGNQLKDLLNQLFEVLEALGNDLSSVVVPPQGSPLVGVNIAGSRAVSKLQEIHRKIENITSKNNFTV